jgi:exodeoxyribonuclease VII large subunit
VIGVVTSPTGAVIRDILHRLRERFPRRVLVWPVLVQGDSAAEQIANAIAGFNVLPAAGAIPRPDLLIVARGGGSIEDLWAFNEEIVVRAAAASEIPLISAVGHETDTTLIDHAADRRAPTPTAAAEIVVPVRADLLAEVIDLGRRQGQAVQRLLSGHRRLVEGLGRGLRGPRDLLALASQRFDDIGERIDRALVALIAARRARLQEFAAMLRPRLLAQEIARRSERLKSINDRLPLAAKRHLNDAARRLDGAAKLLQSLSYKNVLARGYTVVRQADGPALVSVVEAATGTRIDIEFHDGHADAQITGGSTKPKPKSKLQAKPQAKRRGRKGQGELF